MAIRLLVFGLPGTPCFEVSERFTDFHELPFYTVERIPETQESYFDDKIPEINFDTGDQSSGSAQSRMVRDPGAARKDKLLDEDCDVGIDYMSLTTEELAEINAEDQGVVCTEIPDTRLVDWATHVIFFNASEKHAIQWFSERRKCPSCKTVFHLVDKPPRFPNVCDRCGTDLIHREEDTQDSVKRQFMAWRHAFWRLKLTSENQDKLHTYSVDKFDSLKQLIDKVNRDYKGFIGNTKNWYSEFRIDRDGGGTGPLDVNVRTPIQ